MFDKLITSLRERFGLSHIEDDEPVYDGYRFDVWDNYRVYSGREVTSHPTYVVALGYIGLLIELHGQDIVNEIKLVHVENNEEVFLGSGKTLTTLLDVGPEGRIVESGPIEMAPIRKQN